jgi:hypothetical protein
VNELKKQLKNNFRFACGASLVALKVSACLLVPWCGNPRLSRGRSGRCDGTFCVSYGRLAFFVQLLRSTIVIPVNLPVEEVWGSGAAVFLVFFSLYMAVFHTIRVFPCRFRRVALPFPVTVLLECKRKRQTRRTPSAHGLTQARRRRGLHPKKKTVLISRIFGRGISRSHGFLVGNRVSLSPSAHSPFV